MSRRARVSTIASLLVAAVAVTLVPAQAASGQQARGKLFLRNGDLVTANGRNDSLVRFRQKPRGLKAKKVPLGVRLKPKGLSYSKFCEKVAIANSINVVIYDVWSREMEVIEDERFGLVADVQWDMTCNLIIADMGRDSVGRWPRDGVVWSLAPDGEMRRLAGRHNWVNPAFLDMDEWGTLYVLDKAAGAPIPGRHEWHFDAIYKLGAPDFRRPKVRFRRRGIEASAFLAHPDGRFFIGNGDELLVLEGNRLRRPCRRTEFTRINGLALDPELRVFAVDGFDVFGSSRLIRLEDTDTCKVVEEVTGARINGSQGLAVGLPAR